ncbi:protein of unknown function [Nocardioides alpinus]|uniref:DUF4832 domain-containing protein n=1 Tax=Nocardioides alpinus TaxID=748909 RepID=A0A1I0W7Z3_9ACTN|nr:DUF4832 domain-containing protein [Nocardioides alpinus]PKH37735.1 DUF4832 domain-containing protein [Nocardioides alpinus]SFA84408.1 protein of unknown function [Nocardioides alpinus]
MKLSWRTLASAAALGCLVASLGATPPAPAQAADADRTFTMAPLGLGADLPNPLRGQYRWLGGEPTTATVTSNDVYYRDQVYWGRIETSDNVWDFSWLDAGLADAGARGGTFGFRVMAYCPGCWMESREDLPAVTPSFVPRQAGGYVPDWNSPGFLAQWRELMAELGRRYGDDPRLGYVDVGGYGSYGEWHVDAGERVSDANGLAIVEAVTSAFPTKHVLINTMTPVPFTLAALKASPNLGLRTDNLGCPDMYSTVPGDARLQQVWKTRPFFSEWCTRADPVLGAQQVRQFHVSTLSSGNMPWTRDALAGRQRAAYDKALATAGYRLRLRSVTLPTTFTAGSRITVRTAWENQGTAPTYDPWDVQLTLLHSRSGASVTRSLGRPLDGLTGTEKRRAGVDTKGLAKGKYAVYVGVVDPSGYAAPMHLANTGRTTRGTYRVGVVRVR